MQNTLYGGLPPLANIGESGISTKGAYQEAKPSGVNHALELMKEVNNTPRFKTGVIKSGEPVVTVLINVGVMQDLIKEKGFTLKTLYKKTGLSNTAYYSALEGNRVKLKTSENIACALDVDLSQILLEEEK